MGGHDLLMLVIEMPLIFASAGCQCHIWAGLGLHYFTTETVCRFTSLSEWHVNDNGMILTTVTNVVSILCFAIHNNNNNSSTSNKRRLILLKLKASQGAV